MVVISRFFAFLTGFLIYVVLLVCSESRCHHTFVVSAFELRINTKSTSLQMTSQQHIDATIEIEQQTKEKIEWIIRPATLQDHDGCAALIQLSFSTQLVHDYTVECLSKCLPLITTPRQQLLTCNTWYVAEHPISRQIVGCGGWTVRRPSAEGSDSTNNETGNTTTKHDGSLECGAEAAPSCTEPAALVPHLRHFATHPSYMRMGIASSIWKWTHQEIANQFEAEGRPFPRLEVYSTLTAKKFYESCGFVAVESGEITLAKDAAFPIILMRRDPMN
jgi:GNAT superfamily N-acetyltransferase